MMARLLQFHIIGILASCPVSRIVRAGAVTAVSPLGPQRFPSGTVASSGGGAAAVTGGGELGGDFGAEVVEEMGHGDEAAADDAGGDLGDTFGSLRGRISQLVAWGEESSGWWDALFSEKGVGGRGKTYVHKATGKR